MGIEASADVLEIAQSQREEHKEDGHSTQVELNAIMDSTNGMPRMTVTVHSATDTDESGMIFCPSKTSQPQIHIEGCILGDRLHV